MLNATIRTASLALAATGMALAMPASAAPAATAAAQAGAWSQATPAYGDLTFQHGKDRGRHLGWEKQARRDARGNYRGYQNYSAYQPRTRYSEPVYRNTRVWQGNDGRYYCRKSDGTTGLLIGGAVGALLGREVAGRGGDRTLGAILGAAGGALLGKSVDSGTRCG